MRLVTSNTVVLWCVAVYVVSANPDSKGKKEGPLVRRPNQPSSNDWFESDDEQEHDGETDLPFEQVANNLSPPLFLEPLDLDEVPQDSTGTTVEPETKRESPWVKRPNQPSSNDCFESVDCIPHEQLSTEGQCKRENLTQLLTEERRKRENHEVLLGQIKDILQCSISRNLVQEPVTLACGHTCSKDWLQGWEREKGNAATCPICRQPYGLRTEVVMLRKIVDAFKKYNPFNDEFEEREGDSERVNVPVMEEREEGDGERVNVPVMEEREEGDGERVNVPVMEEREGDGERVNVPVMEERAATGVRVNDLLELPGDEELPEGALC